ncbi:MAG: serine/threonine-protein phosphatase [Ruminococcus sp.]|nr:serine/threonine-protein phosphatase [Ruminococcus sp.]
MKIEYSEFTSPGLVRSVNQDSLFAAAMGEYGLFAVADGMGGHSCGEVASARVTEALGKWWNDFSQNHYDFDKCYDDVRQILEDVNKSIFEEYTSQGRICGTTAAVLFIHKNAAFIINSGDTHIYSSNGFKFWQESRDHVFGREAVISGKMTEKEVKKSSDRNKLTAAVGCKKELKMYAACFRIKRSLFFICSDGVYKYCKNSVIKKAVKNSFPEKIISREVNKKGAGDNYSFIRIKILKQE